MGMITMKQLPGIQYDYEYGSIMTMTHKWQALVPYADCGENVQTAIGLIKQRFDDENVNLQITLEADMPQSSLFRFVVTNKKVNYSLREDNLYWSSRFQSSISSEQSSVDYFGNPIILEYDGVQQVAQFQKNVGSGTITATCITRGTYSAAWLADNYYETINSATFRDFGPGVVTCSGITVDAFDVARRGQPNKFRYQFSFMVKRSGWWPWVYFQNGDGLPPVDAVYGTGYGPLDGTGLQSAYRAVDYNAIWPFTLPLEST
jgi:hypothetical protein